MAEESTTRDPVELFLRLGDAVTAGDIDAMMGFFAPDAVWDFNAWGIGTFVGVAAIRSFAEDWLGNWDDHSVVAEEIVGLGSGVVFMSYRETARPSGAAAHVNQRRGHAALFVQGKVARITTYLDPDQARAAAERLAQERG